MARSWPLCVWLGWFLQAVLALSENHEVKLHLGDDTGRQSLLVNTRATLQRDRRSRPSGSVPTLDAAAAPTMRSEKIPSASPKQDSVVLDGKLASLDTPAVAAAGSVGLGYCVCVFATVVVVLATVRFMFMAKPTADEPLDVPSIVVLCGAYVAIAATSDILVKWETQAHGGLLPFVPLRMVFVVELLKLILTLPLVLVRFGRGTFAWPEKADWTTAMRLMFVPAMSYSLNNGIIFFVVSRMDFSSLSVWRQMTPLFVAGIWVLIFRRQLGRQRWLALALLVAGTILNSCSHSGIRFDGMVLVVLCSCLTTAVAGVANEYVLKRCGFMDIDVLCVLLYMQTASISLVLAVTMESRLVTSLTGIAPPVQANTLLGGIPLSDDMRPLAIIALQVLFGFAVARVIRYLGSVPRAVVNAMKELTVVVIAPVFTQSHINSTVIFSMLIVGSAAALFTLAPSPLPTISKAKKAWSPEAARLDQ